MIAVDGKTYNYTKVLPTGDIVHRPQKELSVKGREILDNAISRLWDALPEASKDEVYVNNTKSEAI